MLPWSRLQRRFRFISIDSCSACSEKVWFPGVQLSLTEEGLNSSSQSALLGIPVSVMMLDDPVL